MAAHGGNKDAVNLLLLRGAEVNARDKVIANFMRLVFPSNSKLSTWLFGALCCIMCKFQ